PLLPGDNHSAPDAEGGRIAQQNVSRPIEHNHTNWKRIENLLQQPLARSNLLLAAYTVGDVEGDAHHPDHVPGRITERNQLELCRGRPIIDLQLAGLAGERPAAPVPNTLAVGGLREQFRDG